MPMLFSKLLPTLAESDGFVVMGMLALTLLALMALWNDMYACVLRCCFGAVWLPIGVLCNCLHVLNPGYSRNRD